MTEKSSRFTTSQKVLGAFLVATLAAWGGTAWDAYAMRQDLEVFARDTVEEYRADKEGGSATIHDDYITASVWAGRKYGLFGEPAGKVCIYFRFGGDHYSAVEHYFYKSGGKWITQDSAHAAEEECREEALKAFERAAY